MRRVSSCFVLHPSLLHCTDVVTSVQKLSASALHPHPRADYHESLNLVTFNSLQHSPHSPCLSIRIHLQLPPRKRPLQHHTMPSCPVRTHPHLRPPPHSIPHHPNPPLPSRATITPNHPIMSSFLIYPLLWHLSLRWSASCANYPS